MAEAHKVVRTVLKVQHYLREGNEFQQNLDFAEIVRTKGLDVRNQQILARLQKIQQELSYKNADYFHQQFQLEYAIHDQESLHNQAKGSLNVLHVLEALEIYSYINRLALINRFLLQEKMTKIEVPETQKHLLEVSVVPVRYLDAYPALNANYSIFKLLRKESPKPSDIHMLFQLLQEQEHNLDQESLQEFYTYLRNICILVLSADFGNVEVESTLHRLYKDNLERGYLHYEGKLLPSRYWAVSSNALNVKAFDWAVAFIEKYKHELRDENESQDIYRLNLANYFFATGQFSLCLDHISGSFPFVDYLLTGKRLELKSLYELRSDLLPYKLDAFKMFLSRTSPKLISETQRQFHSDFANLLHQLINSKPGDPKRSEVLIKRIQEKKQAGEWRWLLEKAKALKAK